MKKCNKNVFQQTIYFLLPLFTLVKRAWALAIYRERPALAIPSSQPHTPTFSPAIPPPRQNFLVPALYGIRALTPVPRPGVVAAAVRKHRRPRRK
jgi:hypothetical protein